MIYFFVHISSKYVFFHTLGHLTIMYRLLACTTIMGQINTYYLVDSLRSSNLENLLAF